MWVFCGHVGFLGVSFWVPIWALTSQENVKYLPGITLPEHVKAEPDLKKAKLGMKKCPVGRDE